MFVTSWADAARHRKRRNVLDLFKDEPKNKLTFKNKV